jgi:integrase
MKLPKADKALGGGHLVPLSRQAGAILRELRALTGHGHYVFPSPRTGERPMSDGGVLAALRSMGYDGDTMSGHGFRATARTLVVERLKMPVEWVELQLAHAVKDPNGRAYNRVQWLAERAEMMQAWADYLDRLRSGAAIVPINRVA